MACGKRCRVSENFRPCRRIEKISLEIDDLGRLDILRTDIPRLELDTGTKVGVH